ncbi:tripartite tricarboxylate transporter substrate binding protein [Phreatobacter aquaticus]|uniref:Tripartite tricarboxylate transporter substrate binding protein n=1 Tax=Phreatobacter aquaticus TaxID=2570229 RepID=A0A4D7QBD2_9HYPH|nr:tripartite tricarboxylate transporter substrate binding protein [Phreatobacter aquaticus]QCK85360.1 tripartite tricarboxylate transporter substrate binding protein [Phreatobacter aquaticus]
MQRRTLIKAAAGAALLGTVRAPAVLAQGAWPQQGRTIKVIVPWPPGAANDALGRLLAQRLQEKYGVTAVVENRSGGSGLVGTTAVLQAEPDGYTLLASAFNTAVMPFILKGATFDPQVDLEVMARTAIAPLVSVMTAQRPQKSLGEMIAAAKANPRDWLFAISSLGSAGHLATIEFARRTGIPFDLVPYRGTAPALTDIMSGNVHLLIDPSFALLPAAQDPTRVRALGIATKARSKLAPDLPTMAESGLPGYEFNSWYGVWAPKGTPREISEKVNALIQETMRDPVVANRLTTTLLEPVIESIDDTKRFIASEITRAGELLKLVNFQPA